MSLRRIGLTALALAGCNQVLGLEPPTAVDAGGVDGPRFTPGRVSASSHDYQGSQGDVLDFTVSVELGPPARTCMEVARGGACVATRCDDGVQLSAPHAGEVTFASTQIVVLPPKPDGTYAPYVGGGELFAPGAILQLSAPGADVPAFDEALTAPVPVVFTSPMPVQGGGPIPIQRQAGFLMNWNDGAPDTLVTLIVTSDTSPTVIYCSFQSAAGTGVVPRLVLDELPPGDGDLYSGVLARRDVIHGDFEIQLQAVVVGKHDGGDWAAGPIFLQ